MTAKNGVKRQKTTAKILFAAEQSRFMELDDRPTPVENKPPVSWYESANAW